MTRSEAIAHLARADLSQFPLDERGLTLRTMHGEAWEQDDGWRRLAGDLQEELVSGLFREDPSSSRYDEAIALHIGSYYRGATNEYLLRRLSQLEIVAKSLAGEPVFMEACPCCGYRTLDVRGQFDICLVCWWEDDGQDNENADDLMGGPNGTLTLFEGARQLPRA